MFAVIRLTDWQTAYGAVEPFGDVWEASTKPEKELPRMSGVVKFYFGRGGGPDFRTPPLSASW